MRWDVAVGFSPELKNEVNLKLDFFLTVVVFSHHSSLSSFLSLTETHSFKKMEFQPAEAKKFFSTVRKEMALLATSLPDGIMVKTFEDRMVGFLSLMPGK